MNSERIKKGDDDRPSGPKMHNKPVFGATTGHKECRVAIGEQGTNVSLKCPLLPASIRVD